jgi:hypothetical protein
MRQWNDYRRPENEMENREAVMTEMRKQRVSVIGAGGYKTVTRTVSNIKPMPDDTGCKYRGVIHYLGGEYDVLLPSGKRVWKVDRR